MKIAFMHKIKRREAGGRREKEKGEGEGQGLRRFLS